MARIIHVLLVVSLSCSAAFGQVDTDDLWDTRAGHWVGTLHSGGADYPVVLDISFSKQGPKATLDLPDYCVYGCPAKMTVAQGKVLVRTHLITGLISASFRGHEFAGTARFMDKDARLTMRRIEHVPTIYVEESLNFESADAKLAGTLVKPKGNGPFPVIVWTHGSGPDTRDTFYYHGRAHLFAQHGIASVIYDKRGAGESSGDEVWKLEKLANDATAAIDAIKDRPDIDGKHIGIAGFSQGGWVAPLVASNRKDVSFVLVGATPGITGGEQNIFSMKNRLKRSGFDQDAVEAATTLLRQLYQYYQTGEDRDTIAKAMETAETERWFKDSIFQRNLFLPKGELPDGKHPYWQPFSPDPMEPWRHVHVPVLSMWGELDTNVPAALSRQRIEEALRQANNTDYEMVIFPEADHGMWQVYPKGINSTWPRQAEGSHQTMVDWVKAHVERDK